MTRVHLDTDIGGDIDDLCALALVPRQAEAFARAENFEAKYGQRFKGLPEDFINFQHDPLACAIALGYNGGVEIAAVNLRA